MAGPRITLIRPPILSDPIPGMRRSGMRGINAILITGGILNKSIPIGADIALVSVMTRIFIINTIAARGKVGIKDSMASVLLEPLLVMTFVLLGPGPDVRPGLEPLVLAARPELTGPDVRSTWNPWSWTCRGPRATGPVVPCPWEPLVLASVNPGAPGPGVVQKPGSPCS